MERADVIILGGGLVGLSLALALDRHGLAAIVVDPADPATQIAPAYDGRATAVVELVLADAGDARRRRAARGR